LSCPGAAANILKGGYNLVAMDDKNIRHCSISSVEATVSPEATVSQEVIISPDATSSVEAIARYAALHGKH